MVNLHISRTHHKLYTIYCCVKMQSWHEYVTRAHINMLITRRKHKSYLPSTVRTTPGWQIIAIIIIIVSCDANQWHTYALDYQRQAAHIACEYLVIYTNQSTRRSGFSTHIVQKELIKFQFIISFSTGFLVLLNFQICLIYYSRRTCGAAAVF